MAVKLEQHEETAFKILEQFFDSPIQTIEPINEYKRTTPDFIINGVAWELKSITSSSLSTLEKRFRKAKHQSVSIVIDLRRSSIDEAKALRSLKKLLIVHRRVKRLLCITKSESVIVIKW